MADTWGNIINHGNEWRAGVRTSILWETDTAIAYNVQLIVQTKWAYDVYANGSVVSNVKTNVNDGQTSASYNGVLTQGVNGTSSIGAGQIRMYTQFSVQYAKTHSNYNVTFTSTYNVTGGYGNGTSRASQTVTVKAKPSYTVGYNANGGSGAPGNQTKWYGERLTLATARPARTGHNFLYWTTDFGSGSVRFDPGGAYDHNRGATLYANWQAHTYTVSYNANGGSGAPGAQTKTYGKTLTLSSVRPTRTNYNFKGWATSASGGVVYQPGGSYTNNSAVTLYAVWELAWREPRITNLKADRCNSAGTLTDEGQYAKVTFNWATDRAMAEVRITCNSQNYYPYNEGGPTSGNVSMVIGNNQLKTDSQYTVNVYIQDQIGNVTIPTTVAPMFYIIDINGPQNGISFGVPATEYGTVLSSLPIRPLKGFKFSKSFDGEGGTVSWVKLGTLKNTSDSKSTIITVYAGSGWNSSAMQNSWFTIFIKDGWQQSTSTTSAFGVYVEGHNIGSKNLKVKVLATAHNQCDVWIWQSYSYWWGKYNICTDDIWEPAPNISQTTEPTGGVSQSVRIYSSTPMEYSNGYYGLTCPSANDSNEHDWIRTTENGIIPQRPGGASSLGTSSWPFSNIWSSMLNLTGNGLSWSNQGGLKGRVAKQLWSGTWTSGSITANEAPYYNIFLVAFNSNITEFGFGIRQPSGGTIAMFGVNWISAQYVNFLKIGIGGTKMTMSGNGQTRCSATDSISYHNNACGIFRIWGIL